MSVILAAPGLHIELGRTMGNNSELEIARWEYEGGSIGREEAQSQKPIPGHNALRTERPIEGACAKPARHSPPRGLGERLHLSF
jgi:hypothetical protein